jgi:hypothetical protein
MDWDKFKDLSPEEQQEILEKSSRLIKERAESTGCKRPKTPPPSAIKRELQSPETPHKGGSKKVLFLSLVTYL